MLLEKLFRKPAPPVTLKSTPEELFRELARGGDPHRFIPTVDLQGRPNIEGGWPLFLAVMRHVHDLEALDRVLLNRPDLNIANRYGDGILHIAAKYSNSVAVIDRLLDLGIDVNVRHQPTFSPHADGDPGPPWSTPLISAIEQPNPDIVKRLLQRGADPNVANTQGHTALRFAKDDPMEVHCAALLAAGAKMKVPRSRQS